MYLVKSIIDGLKILGFDKETILMVSKEKSLEEIFLSTLFMNYLIVLIAFVIGVIAGDINTGVLTIRGLDFNMPVIFGLMMIYPFLYNVGVYFLYALFGLIAEMLNTTKKVKPLISAGFHTAIVYTILVYVIVLISLFNPSYGLFLSGIFAIYFLLAMFLSISTIYGYSAAQTLIVLIIPLLIIGTILLLSLYFVDASTIISLFLI